MNILQPRIITCLLVLGLLYSAPFWADAGEVFAKALVLQSQLDRFQGTWKVVSIETGLAHAPAEVTSRLKIMFRGNRVERIAGKQVELGSFRIDPFTTPKAIDITPPLGLQPGVGEDRADPNQPKSITKPDVSRGIYSFDGDRLTICLARPGAERPRAIPSEPGPDIAVARLEFERPLAPDVSGNQRWHGVSSMQSQEPLDQLRRTADDPALSNRVRALAIYKIFANYLRPPEDSKAVSRVFGKATWLAQARIVYIAGWGGGWPAGLEIGNGRIFYCHPFSDDKREKAPVMLFSISGLKSGTAEELERNAIDFFRGDAGTDCRLEYFWLTFPDNHLEVFCKKGNRVYDSNGHITSGE
jgi:uncharacterized protein (TIGR03067 family)